MALTNADIQRKLTEKFPEAITGFQETYGIFQFEVQADMNLKVLTFLHDDPELNFPLMTDLCAVHDPSLPGRELAVVYHLHNLKDNLRIRVKCFIPIAQPNIYTASGLYASANWQERETYDFYGVNFVGHPNLKRILNVDEMDYFPMRKEYPLEDATRIDKDDEMFGRGGSLGYGTEKSIVEGTIPEDEKGAEGDPIL